MSLLVTGSIGIDTVETPAGRVDGVLGGSTIYFSLAAAAYSAVRIVGVVGEDFDMGLLEPLAARKIDTGGLEVRAGSKTFRWHGRYAGAMDAADTVEVDLNVLAEQSPPIPDDYLDSQYVFLANTHPALQLEIAQRFSNAKLIFCDTMNLWIENEPEALRRTLGAVHGLVLNEGEAALLTGTPHLVEAAEKIRKLGPKYVVIKKGSNGSLFLSDDDLFALPAYPTKRIVDPTGCGDSFAGAMMGYLAKVGTLDRDAFRAAIARGTVAGSIVLESFSVEASATATQAEIDRRLGVLKDMVSFE